MNPDGGLNQIDDERKRRDIYKTRISKILSMVNEGDESTEEYYMTGGKIFRKYEDDVVMEKVVDIEDINEISLYLNGFVLEDMSGNIIHL